MKAISEFHVFGALEVPSTAESDNHVHIVWRYVLAADIAVIIVFAIEWTDIFDFH